jgi:hypothetical protein
MFGDQISGRHWNWVCVVLVICKAVDFNNLDPHKKLTVAYWKLSF